MSAFGCPQCGARMANPRTPAVQGTISFGCTQQALKHKTQPEDHSGSDNGNDDSADQTGAGDANSEYAGDRSTNENLRPAAESAKQRSTDSFGPFPAQPTTTVYPPDRSRALPADSSVNSTESVPSSAVPSPTAAQPSSVPPASTAPRGSMLGVFFTNGRRSAIAIMLVMVAAIVLVAVRALKTL
jgi:hypothetical protein